MKVLIHEMIRMGLSPAQAVDYYFVEIAGATQRYWSNERGVSQQAVSQNVCEARRKLPDDYPE